jgi:hypothetical protein
LKAQTPLGKKLRKVRQMNQNENGVQNFQQKAISSIMGKVEMGKKYLEM